MCVVLVENDFEFLVWGANKYPVLIQKNVVPARIISFGGQMVRPWRSSVAFNCESVGLPKREWLRGDQILKVIT